MKRLETLFVTLTMLSVLVAASAVPAFAAATADDSSAAQAMTRHAATGAAETLPCQVLWTD